MSSIVPDLVCKMYKNALGQVHVSILAEKHREKEYRHIPQPYPGSLPERLANSAGKQVVDIDPGLIHGMIPERPWPDGWCEQCSCDTQRT